MRYTVNFSLLLKLICTVNGYFFIVLLHIYDYVCTYIHICMYICMYVCMYLF